LAYHHGTLRESLLERAAEVVALHGIEALSMRGLARDLGVSHAAPSRHFADRSALLCELAKAGFERSVAAMKRGAESAGADPVARYRALGRAYVRFACEQPAFFRAMNHPEVQALMDSELHEAHRVFFSTLREGVRAAQTAGWHPEADPDALIAFSISAAMGAASLLSDARWQQSLGVDDLDALADDVLDLVVQRSQTTALPEAEPNEHDDTHDRRAS
jgi:AcrR family transcriptional regulator